jgi:hypothetical protein
VTHTKWLMNIIKWYPNLTMRLENVDDTTVNDNCIFKNRHYNDLQDQKQKRIAH